MFYPANLAYIDEHSKGNLKSLHSDKQVNFVPSLLEYNVEIKDTALYAATKWCRKHFGPRLIVNKRIPDDSKYGYYAYWATLVYGAKWHIWQPVCYNIVSFRRAEDAMLFKLTNPDWIVDPKRHIKVKGILYGVDE